MADGTVLALYRVMQAMCLQQAREIPLLGYPAEAAALVHEHVVHEGINAAVQRDAECCPPQRFPPEPDDEQHDRHDREDDCVEVVLFEPAVMIFVMRLVPAPAPAVHDIAMRRPREALHEQHHEDDDREFLEPGHFARSHELTVDGCSEFSMMPT